MKNDELLHKWVNGNLSSDEQKEFEQRPEYNSLQRIKRGIGLLSGPELQQEVILTNILSEKKTASSTNNRGRIHYLLPYAAAAAVLLLIGFFVFRAPAPTIFSAGLAQRVATMLPDQSTVSLNAESEVSFQASKWPGEREVQLVGEAFFAVEEGSTFTVNTSAGEITVVGTRFNVVSRNGLLEVSCFSGKVMVQYLLQEISRELKAGEAIRFSENEPPVTWMLDEAEKQASWLDGITKLQTVPLERAVAELERQFGVQIKTNNVDMKRVVTVNFQQENLEEALMTVFRPLNIRYDIKGEQQVNLFQE
ncbi:FecR family protein [Lewinella cohaerens]|uniref:FecR family protein n=1 Tax=Lewinella cohaerens TaxID=70995 RepID=UPI00037CB97A|nr:FecR domain-containing protein [Lewinella cohaerens]